MLDRILSWYTKLFVLWVFLFCGLAYYFHEQAARLEEGMDLFFALTMFGIGAVLNVDDFKRIARRPGIVLIGVTSQFLVMPLGAFVLANMFQLPPLYALGFILAGSAPGAMSSNVICHIAKADTAYSVSLTAVATLLCPILTPLLVKLLAESHLPVDALNMIKHLLLVVLLPLIIGLSLNTLFSRAMARVAKVFPAIAVTFIVFICAVVVSKHHDKWLGLSPNVVVVAVLLNLFGMSAGYGIGKLFRLSASRCRTLTIEIGMQNAGLGAVLASIHFASEPAVAVPPVIFVFVCIFTASILVGRWSARPLANEDQLESAEETSERTAATLAGRIESVRDHAE